MINGLYEKIAILTLPHLGFGQEPAIFTLSLLSFPDKSQLGFVSCTHSYWLHEENAPQGVPDELLGNIEIDRH